MDSPKNQKSEEPPQAEEIPWWEKTPNKEASREKLIEQIKAMQYAQRGIPRGLVLKQGAALVFILINAGFLYSNLTTPAAGYIAAYMLPLSALLIDYFLVVAELKKIARGEKK
ncbi:MAG: hypothetical protein A2Z70_00755 [Chloroflexi bacterium RBG_13_48_17]|nr:MAG: hypothetical protein A2Z70_00755 [Chloroflexi bacterium RBG_13_48_17]